MKIKMGQVWYLPRMDTLIIILHANDLITEFTYITKNFKFEMYAFTFTVIFESDCDYIGEL